MRELPQTYSQFDTEFSIFCICFVVGLLIEYRFVCRVDYQQGYCDKVGEQSALYTTT